MNIDAQTLSNISPHQLQRLLEISTLLSSKLDLQELLSFVIEVAADLTNSEEASIILVDEKTGELHFEASSGSPQLAGMQVPRKNSLAGLIIQNKKPLRLQDVQADKRHYRFVDQFTDVRTRTLMGVPMFNKGRVIGTLEAINKRDDTRYTLQDIALLQALASQAAVAITNARLFQQTDVVAEVVHELKTPLLALTAASELLSRPQLPEDKHQQLIYTIQSEAKRLTKLTQDFLDLSRLDSGRVRLSREPVNLVQLAQDVVRIQSSQAAQANVALEIVCDRDDQGKIPYSLGDPDRLKQVLLNLVSNAIKYNVENGTVTIHIQPKPEERAVVVSVIDTGTGIAEADLPFLFDRFYRVPSSEGYSEGTGLGLPIAKKILEAHKGRIEVESELGKGTTFRCVLPISDDK